MSTVSGIPAFVPIVAFPGDTVWAGVNRVRPEKLATDAGRREPDYMLKFASARADFATDVRSPSGIGIRPRSAR